MLLPEIISVHDGGNGNVLIDLRVPPELPHFSGHFPDLPILPGVVQIDWAFRLASQHLSPQGKFTRLDNLKLHIPVQPGAHLQLALVMESAGKTINFTYTLQQRKCSSGQFVFSGQV